MRGDRSASNVRLLCKCHNLYIAELDFGKATDRVGEPVPSIELCPGRVEPRPLVASRIDAVRSTRRGSPGSRGRRRPSGFASKLYIFSTGLSDPHYGPGRNSELFSHVLGLDRDAWNKTASLSAAVPAGVGWTVN